MSVAVEVAELLGVAGRFGTVPMLLTTDPDGRPRAAATTLDWALDDDPPTVVASAGRRSLGNAAERPLVSLLWPAPPGDRFALLVDCEVSGTQVRDERGGGFAVLTVGRGILHVVGPVG